MLTVFSIFLIFNLLIYFGYGFISRSLNIFDKPDNERKIHLKETSVAGGLIIYINLILFFVIFFFFDNSLINEKILSKDVTKEVFSFFGTATLIFTLGLLDDKYNLTPNVKLGITFVIILATIQLDPNLLIEQLYFSNVIQPILLGKLSLFFSVVCFLLFINSFNMFDGVDLQAGIYAIGIFIFLLIKNYLGSSFAFIIIPLIFFLILNFKKKCFLGNGGSFLLSYIIAYLIVKIYHVNYTLRSDEIFLLMLIPGLDLVRLFFIRIVSKKNPFFPDNNHIHHRLVKKVGQNKSQLLLQTLIFLPIVVNSYMNFSYIFIFVSIFIYFALLRYTGK